MALATKTLPYGLRDVKLKSIGADGVRGTPVDLPVSRTFSFTESEDFEELRGDDGVAASHGSGPTVSWELEGGGISFEAYKVMAGGLITTSGVSPNIKKSFLKKKNDSRPYFQVEGQAVSDNGGDFHVIVYRCKANEDLSGELSDGSFWLTGASGVGIAEDTLAGDMDSVYEFVHNETETAIV